jgi:low affinity Fe/Cu permease
MLPVMQFHSWFAALSFSFGRLRPDFQILGHRQLVINTGTTIVTFLMVFLIQNTQNRDGAAIQAKLDELIRVTAASNSFIGIEHLTEEEVNEFRTKCKAAAEKAGHAAVKKAGAKARKAADEAV